MCFADEFWSVSCYQPCDLVSLAQGRPGLSSSQPHFLSPRDSRILPLTCFLQSRTSYLYFSALLCFRFPLIILIPHFVVDSPTNLESQLPTRNHSTYISTEVR
ncbi:hypothetical protein BDW69DRAFT_29564 [Aspergillus filifer]